MKALIERFDVWCETYTKPLLLFFVIELEIIVILYEIPPLLK